MTKGVFVQTKHCCKAFLEQRYSGHHKTFEIVRHRAFIVGLNFRTLEF